MSINVEYNNKEINQRVVTNILKMLEQRKLINSWSFEYKQLSDVENKTSFEIMATNKSKVGIYLVNAKISSIVSGTPLDEYLSNNLDVHKIIVAKSVQKKVVKQIISEYKNAEFFFEHEMMEDIPSAVFVPEHQLLTKEEKVELLSKYSEHELSRIHVTDRMARQYGAIIGDIFRVIRPSVTAGHSIGYRKVVPGSWDILFPSS